ncbi:hypothetical protein BKA70DRAFT_1093223 [Coprinopsis sp. MPI-PUGE-AT-0042]|nr:hypothetical protein BKA70DRAFT_1093223 [Coprinopsis sp. MPI-PUGE-AT-0042]
MHLQSDYPNDFETAKIPQQVGGRMNGFTNNFGASFTAYPNTNRQQTNPSTIGGPSLRDTNTFYPGNADVFPGQVTSPIQPHLQPYEGNPPLDFNRRGYPESFGPNSAPAPHHSGRHSVSHGQPQGRREFNGNHQFSGPIQLTSQTPYGPHLPIPQANGPGNPPHGPSQQPPREQNPAGANAQNSQQEEISTIFVVGFPDDMHEREFQNMFTFSSGFEAATLKIPNKEYTAYGANGIRGFQGYNGSNDPYNLVTMNQGGVVVDGGRDGTMSSWPAVPGDEGAHFGGVNLTPRKQIIGFAKFKSREAALEARDILQGRRVDIEKGAILKAEMAKKNLHTKRGVGPVAGPALPGPISASNSMQSNTHGNAPMVAHPNEVYHPADVFPPRERDLPLGGLDLGRHGTWRDQLQKDVLAVTNGIHSHGPELNPRKEREEEENRRRERDATMYSAMGIGGTRGPRERAEEEERERRKAKEARLRASNSTAFDAFHSVPAGNAPALSRTNSGVNVLAGTGSLMSSMEGRASLGSSPHLSHAFASSQHDEVGPWDRVPTASNGITRPGSERSSSPPDARDFVSGFPIETHRVVGARPPSESSASSVVGSNPVGVIGGGSSVVSNGSDPDLTNAMSELVLNTDNGTTSPQLPSPDSGASSNGTKNVVDQNPPINTLYVGNLPAASPSAGFSNDQLEDSIRHLFQAQPGYRRLVFRQKNNGPMCFVEFEDVPLAAKALNDLYGNTLNGLVKGGIRLSYSKNPLGVRTPISGSNGSFQHQQAMQSLNFHSDQFHARGSGDRDPPLAQPHIARRESAYNNSFLTSPPPRFTSPPMGNFGQQPNQGSFGVRTNGGSLPGGLYSFGGLNSQGPNGSFTPFALNNPPTIPEHPSSDDSVLHSSHHFAHRALSPPVNLEAARAG